MPLPRKAHSRRDWRGPTTPDGKRQQLAYNVAKIARPVRVSHRILSTLVVHGRGLYEIHPALISEWRMATEDALPFIRDLEGSIWS